MKLEKWALIAEIVGSFAIVVTLVILVVEIRTNTEAVRATTAQSLISSSRDFLLALALDEDFSRIRQLGQIDQSTLTDDEVVRCRTFARGNWLYFQNVWIQWTLGVVDDRVWQSFVRIFCASLDAPGTRADWSYHVEAPDPQFVAFVEACSR